MFYTLLQAAGPNIVITVNVIDEKLALAKEMGADCAFNSKTVEIKSRCASSFPRNWTMWFNQTMELIKYNGKICCYGISPKLSIDLDWSKVSYKLSLNFVQ